MKKKKLGVSNTPYDGGRWVTDGGWWVTDGGWWVTDGGWWVTNGGWWVTNGSWWVTDGGWWVTDGGWWVRDGSWWVATKHQRVDAIAGKKRGGERPYGTPCFTDEVLASGPPSVLASGLSTLCSAEASLPSSGVGVA